MDVFYGLIDGFKQYCNDGMDVNLSVHRFFKLISIFSCFIIKWVFIAGIFRAVFWLKL